MSRRRLWRLILRPPMLGAAVVLTCLLVLSAWPSAFTQYSPRQIALAERLMPPTSRHWFGTDNFGRDLFSRVIFGARISLLTGAAVIPSAAALGIVVGTAAAYGRVWGDELLMRLTDVFLAVPVILLTMAIVVVLGPSLTHTTLALIIVWWPAYARLVRAQVLAIKERAHVEAAAAIGAGSWRIIRRHVLPHAMTPLLVQSTMDIGYVLLTAASLGFLGLGAQPPTPEWGAMVSEGRRYFLEAWWYPVFPGLAIALTVLASNLIGDELRDWMDPHTRRR